MTLTVLTVAAVVLLVGAGRRCTLQAGEERARVRRAAELAEVFGRALHRWERATAALADGLRPLLDPTASPAAGRTGFGDRHVADARWRRAWRAARLVEEEQR